MKPPKHKTEGRQPFYKNKARMLTLAIALFFMVIMVSSVLEIYVQNRDDTGVYDYNGVKFTDLGNGWLANLESGRQLYIVSNPKELENISISPVNLDSLNYMPKIYLSYNPQGRTRIAVSEFLREIKLQPRLVPACPTDNDACKDMPLKTCADATSSAAVILFKESNETSVTFINNCLTIEGKDLTKAVDKLILVTQI